MTFVAAPLLCASLCGCQTAPAARAHSSTDSTRAVEKTHPAVGARNNAASLLYNLLGDEKHVSKLLIIKRDRRELHDVIKAVSDGAKTSHEALTSLAKTDRSLNLESTDLPLGEQAARDAESKTRRDLLLHSKGAEFEFQLLLTQAEALAYAEHLAIVAAVNEPVPERAKVYREIAALMANLHKHVVDLLRKD